MKRKEPRLVLGAGSALGFSSLGFSLSQSSPMVGSPERRVPPKFYLEDSTPKTLIQYKHKCKDMRKPKLVVGQREHDDVGFLRRGFSIQARPLLSWQIAVILRHPTPLAHCLMLLRWLRLWVVSSLSLRWSGLFFVPRWGLGLRGKRIRL